jgi:hypothetical protein
VGGLARLMKGGGSSRVEQGRGGSRRVEEREQRQKYAGWV